MDRRPVFATCLAALVATAACVMPQHRTIASVVNAAVVSTGLAVGIANAMDESNHETFQLFDPEIGEAAGALIVAGLFAEVLTLALHHDDPSPPPASRHDVIR